MSDRLEISSQEQEAVLQLDGEARYRYFIKRVADWETAWGLWDDGWVVAAKDDGSKVFPLWPAREFADVCAAGDWASAEAREIEIRDLLDELLPRLHVERVSPGIFFTPTGKGVTPAAGKLREHLELELEQYE